MSTSTAPGGHAVVIGGSLAGMSAARALRDRFATVTVLEQDAFPSEPAGRRGTPQAWHNHFLLDVGRETLDELFPGFASQLLANGGQKLDPAYDAISCLADAWAPRCRSSMQMLFASRPTVEATVRQLLTRDAGVRIVQGARVESLLSEGSGSGTRVTGVAFRDPESGTLTDLAADLVVDAAGRGSKLLPWMKALGHEVEELTLDAKVSYSSRWYKWPTDTEAWWRWLTVFPSQDKSAPLEHQYLSSIFPIEDNGFIAVMCGWGVALPTDEDAFQEAAARTRSKEFGAMLAAAAPTTGVHHMKSGRNVWRRMDKITSPPAGFLAVGDGVCAFNPIYAQGMSSAAMNGKILRRVLATADATTNDLPRRFYGEQAKFLQMPWALAMSRDGAYPHAVGSEALPDGFKRRILEKYSWSGFTFITDVAWTEPAVDAAFTRVFNLQESLGQFLRNPRVLLGILRHSVKVLLRRTGMPTPIPLPGSPSEQDHTRARYGADHPPVAEPEPSGAVA